MIINQQNSFRNLYGYKAIEDLSEIQSIQCEMQRVYQWINDPAVCNILPRNRQLHIRRLLQATMHGFRAPDFLTRESLVCYLTHWEPWDKTLFDELFDSDLHACSYTRAASFTDSILRDFEHQDPQTERYVEYIGNWVGEVIPFRIHDPLEDEIVQCHSQFGELHVQAKRLMHSTQRKLLFFTIVARILNGHVRPSWRTSKASFKADFYLSIADIPISQRCADNLRTRELTQHDAQIYIASEFLDRMYFVMQALDSEHLDAVQNFKEACKRFYYVPSFVKYLAY